MTSNQLQRYVVCLDPLGVPATIIGFTKDAVYLIHNKVKEILPRNKFMKSFVLDKKRTKQENLDNYREKYIPKIEKVKNTYTAPLSRYTATKGNRVIHSKLQKSLAKKIGSTPENFRFSLKNGFKCNGYVLARIVEGQDEYYETE